MSSPRFGREGLARVGVVPILASVGIGCASIVCLAHLPRVQDVLPTATVRDAVQAYAAGQFEQAIGAVTARRPRAGGFIRDLEHWLSDCERLGGVRCRLIAVAFALDAVWATTRGPANEMSGHRDPWPTRAQADPDEFSLSSWRAQAFVSVWAAHTLPEPPFPIQRDLCLAILGIAQDGHAWHQIEHDIVPAIRVYLGDDPRLSLAVADARSRRRLDVLSDRRLGLRRAVLRSEVPSAAAHDAIRRAIVELEPLTSDRSLFAEANLRIGYLEMSRRSWSAALSRLDAALDDSTEPALRAAAHYFRGWVHEQRNNIPAAVADYRRAIDIEPTMRNPATRLSALLFIRAERDEAYAILDRALQARPPAQDPVMLLEHGDARFVAHRLNAIRRSLR